MAETVIVVGATGSQGGGVVDHLLADKRKKYHIRAVSRNTSSAKAEALADQGVEVVQGDLGDKDSLMKAFRGGDALFLVTDFSTAKTMEKEYQQGKNAVDAAKEAGVKFIIFSTLETMPPDVMADLPKLKDGPTVPHFQSKAMAQEYLEQSGLPHACLLTSIFFDNFAKLFHYHIQEDGSFVFTNNLGNAPHAWHAAADVGGSVTEILCDPQKYQGKVIPVNSGCISSAECAEALSKVTGKKIRYSEMTDGQFALSPFPFARELANMFAYYKRWPYYDQLRDPSKVIYKGPTFAVWAQQNAKDINAHIAA